MFKVTAVRLLPTVSSSFRIRCKISAPNTYQCSPRTCGTAGSVPCDSYSRQAPSSLYNTRHKRRELPAKRKAKSRYLRPAAEIITDKGRRECVKPAIKGHFIPAKRRQKKTGIDTLCKRLPSNSCTYYGSAYTARDTVRFTRLMGLEDYAIPPYYSPQ